MLIAGLGSGGYLHLVLAQDDHHRKISEIFSFHDPVLHNLSSGQLTVIDHWSTLFDSLSKMVKFVVQTIQINHYSLL